MEALLKKAPTLRSFLQNASIECRVKGDVTLEQNLACETDQAVSYALDHTFLIPSHPAEGFQSLPRSPWNSKTNVSHLELVHHVIERLLVRKRSINWKDADLLTLGYREVTPECPGHRLMQSNGIMCYYPNTLVATLKSPLWKSLHELMGDDLMMHLLLNYSIFVQLKDARDSYMQLTGKSLHRQSLYPTNKDTVHPRKREVSINHVMYARYFQKDRVFASSHVLVKASKTGNPIGRTQASRVLRSIFPETASQKRLPKRLINLIPTIQTMVSRFQSCQVEKLAMKIIPIHPEFRKYMADNPSLKRKVEERAAEAKTWSQPLLSPIVRNALDNGYLSQDEVIAPSSRQKRKRREEAIESLSLASGGVWKKEVGESAYAIKRQKSSHADSKKDPNAHKPVVLTTLQRHKEDIHQLLAFATPKKKIYRLVRKFVAIVVPKEVWGSSHTKKNWKCVKMMLRKFIFSRKFDTFSLKKCANELQVSNVKWMKAQPSGNFWYSAQLTVQFGNALTLPLICLLVSCSPPNERLKRQQLFEDLLWWMMSSLLFPLLQNLFYITEAEGMANEIKYYQRPVWNVISTLALDDLKSGILQLSGHQISRHEAKDRLLATSRLRLLPKVNGVRPLMNLSVAVEQTKPSVNRSMEAVHRVLSFEMERQSKRLLGASVRNVDEIYKRLKPLFGEISSCSRCQEQRRASGTIPMAYCVTVDVERCFDTIRPRILYRMLKRILQEDEYLIRKHWVGHEVAPRSSNHDQDAPSSSFFFKLERPAFPSGEFLGFDELAAQSAKKPSVFVDGVLYDYLTKAKALALLKEHLSMNTVEMDGHAYVQQCGIPQGSVLSTTLCNMYYAQFERRVLRKHLSEVRGWDSDTSCQHDGLFRYTDDFMYITTDLKRAQTFFKVMHDGNEEYGCFVNMAKSQANFNVGTRAEETRSRSKGAISWCGMLIDFNKLQIYVNYEKLSSLLLQGSIPLNETKAAREFFVNKVISPIRQRWHALYFDPDLLSSDTIQVNLFQMLLVAAHRFTILIEMLPFVNRDMHFFHKSWRQILNKMAKTIHRSLHLHLADSTISKRSLSYPAQKLQVWTIGFYAFQLTLQVKRDQVHARHHQGERPPWRLLLANVEKDMKKHRVKMEGRHVVSDLNWLLHDERNASVLRQALDHTVDSR